MRTGLQGQLQLSSVGLSSVLTVHTAKKTKFPKCCKQTSRDSWEHSDARPLSLPLGPGDSVGSLISPWPGRLLPTGCHLEHKVLTVGQATQHGLFGHQLSFLWNGDITTGCGGRHLSSKHLGSRGGPACATRHLSKKRRNETRQNIHLP